MGRDKEQGLTQDLLPKVAYTLHALQKNKPEFACTGAHTSSRLLYGLTTLVSLKTAGPSLLFRYS